MSDEADHNTGQPALQGPQEPQDRQDRAEAHPLPRILTADP